ncbi:photosynthetic reaction center cytochrome PufC [Belnapia rosea]|uniref:Photosynthetic reaction center cytochrome c subunit n=1 Tax=Belnapia rosea TaxID=938405 RepID=A0A1G6YGQ9_9PROT|nr:photosynthetic reaction center cytochrome PufC [Belnapia rosea]SDD89558.1 photosynthetic reaction center cytochrome c subunit [Belnapia rosea]
MSFSLKLGAVLAGLLGLAVILLTFERPPVDTVQTGFRGVALGTVSNPRLTPALAAANQVPNTLPRVPSVGPRAGQAYQNVQVLGELGVAEFARTMAAMTAWVSPQQGCGYCHNTANMASDEVYTKVVARRMLQMVARINAEWKPHVAETGVTCYTCHRGNPVPLNVWAENPGPMRAGGFSASSNGQNLASPVVGDSSLPYDPFSRYLDQASNIRVQTPDPLPAANPQTIKDAEFTYGLMMHFSQALGVNCTTCHNSRAFSAWDQSAPQRTSAWHGIRMVRDINHNFIDPLQPIWAANPNGPASGPHRPRLGPQEDALKVNCTTCHQGVNKPLNGVSMLRDYPELGRITRIDAPPPIRQ